MQDSAKAVGALGRAAGLERAARRRSGWYARYLWVFAAGQLVLVPMAVLWRGPVSGVVFGVTNALLVTGLSVYAVRQRVMRRGFGMKHGMMMASWTVVFALTITVGTAVFGHGAPFAAVGALACALPPAVGAWTEMRGAV
ncbi:hypothetical protein Snoj_52430 [Streptomyces nojiriensis]|uniref:Integral membrane protein n=1 Tax=Streptomyces nojiriensis TaxID=66374 RepID=A0ABQ3SU69_9ACTN|nr:hypothetical protein [Streptomyces nojiriensis]QTI44875.1 hypothetical protein JYK04_02657 [Streptomyces nojiriensis]GGR92016.1 hypothetical protein GCM10010205_20670 [Streptomyces nojiriensis]GHI71325.1 hypothetical protein Snoj_52430 [Streptomyces nojiriensis]